MKDAYNLEKLAVRDQGRAMQICADYPVEYNYGWENDLTLDQIVAILKDPNVHEPPADIFATVDQSTAIDSVLLQRNYFQGAGCSPQHAAHRRISQCLIPGRITTGYDLRGRMVQILHRTIRNI